MTAHGASGLLEKAKIFFDFDTQKAALVQLASENICITEYIRI